jgi:hypothetical protein
LVNKLASIALQHASLLPNEGQAKAGNMRTLTQGPKRKDFSIVEVRSIYPLPAKILSFVMWQPGVWPCLLSLRFQQ